MDSTLCTSSLIPKMFRSFAKVLERPQTGFRVPRDAGKIRVSVVEPSLV